MPSPSEHMMMMPESSSSSKRLGHQGNQQLKPLRANSQIQLLWNIERTYDGAMIPTKNNHVNEVPQIPRRPRNVYMTTKPMSRYPRDMKYAALIGVETLYWPALEHACLILPESKPALAFDLSEQANFPQFKEAIGIGSSYEFVEQYLEQKPNRHLALFYGAEYEEKCPPKSWCLLPQNVSEVKRTGYLGQYSVSEHKDTRSTYALKTKQGAAALLHLVSRRGGAQFIRSKVVEQVGHLKSLVSSVAEHSSAFANSTIQAIEVLRRARVLKKKDQQELITAHDQMMANGADLAATAKKAKKLVK